MKQLSGKELIALLESNGWALARIRGSHHIMVKEGNPARISIPVHTNQTLKIGLLKHFLKTAGLEDIA